MPAYSKATPGAAPMFQSHYDGFVYRHDDPVFHDSIQRGQSEPYPRDLAVIQRYLRAFPHKNRAFIDVGAHIGTTIMPLLRHYQHCAAYEPNPTNHRFLFDNLRANGMADRCTVRAFGCSDRRRLGKTVMHGGANSGCYYFAEQEGSGEGGDLVATVCLDDDAHLTDVDFLKIDTEGHELFVLRGAEKLIRRCRPLIQVELNGLAERLFGVPERQVLDFLAGLGARPYGGTKGGNLFFYFPDVSLAIAPRTIFCFWTGTNAMSDTRRAALQTIPDARLITPENLADFVLESEPLHPAYALLSETHKADYLRTYFMHFYGGGYADIKAQTGPWEPAFERVLGEEAVYASGYPEARPSHIAHPDYAQHYASIIGNGAYVFRPDTPLTREWYGQMLAFLDSVYARLKEHPAAGPQDCAERGGGYPIEWNQMLGRIFHPLVYKYRDAVRADLCEPCLVNYR
jgi:FkbM family methyltransferase